MKTLLICHASAPLDRIGLARWLNSWCELAGILVLDETRGRTWQRVRAELRRSGVFGFADVLAFRLYYKLRLAKRDAVYEAVTLDRLKDEYPHEVGNVPTLTVGSANSKEAEAFIRDHAPDVMIARCKTLLKPRIFDIPATGTFVLHPGMCPEYRNAHGCFWALANNEPEKVAMTLLKIDAGVDTGPVYGYFGCNEVLPEATHIEIQQRTVFDNLPEIERLLQQIHEGDAEPLDTSGRPSAVWGQPHLTKYLSWKRRERKTAPPNDTDEESRRDASELTAVS